MYYKEKKKEITFKNVEILKGAEKLCKAVSSTLGPAGRNVIIEDEYENPHSTKDGVTVAKSIILEDNIENMGAQLLKEASIQTVQSSGDGTTTSTVIAHSVIKDGFNKIKELEVNPIEIKRGLEAGLSYVRTKLLNSGIDIRNNKDIQNIATISANNDKRIGELVFNAIDGVGNDGVVLVEDSKKSEDLLEFVDGILVDGGYMSPYLVTNMQRMEAELDNPLILIYDGTLTSSQEIAKNILEPVIIQKRQLLIIANDIQGEALGSLILNKSKGILNVCAIKAPHYGERRTAYLEDLSVMTGATCYSTNKGISIKKATLDNLGGCESVKVSKSSTTIVKASGIIKNKEAVIDLIKRIENDIENATSPNEKELLRVYLAKFTNNIAILKVGADTEIELKERKDRIDDALNATKSAIAEGIVIGGGMSLMNIASKFKEKDIPKSLSYGEMIGFKILINSIQSPFNTIIENGGENPEVIFNNIQSKRNPINGYNVLTRQYVDLLKDGVINPIKVERVALEKAVSVAGIFLLTSCVITNIDEKEDEQPMY